MHGDHGYHLGERLGLPWVALDCFCCSFQSSTTTATSAPSDCFFRFRRAQPLPQVQHLRALGARAAAHARALEAAERRPADGRPARARRSLPDDRDARGRAEPTRRARRGAISSDSFAAPSSFDCCSAVLTQRDPRIATGIAHVAPHPIEACHVGSARLCPQRATPLEGVDLSAAFDAPGSLATAQLKPHAFTMIPRCATGDRALTPYTGWCRPGAIPDAVGYSVLLSASECF